MNKWLIEAKNVKPGMFLWSAGDLWRAVSDVWISGAKVVIEFEDEAAWYYYDPYKELLRMQDGMWPARFVAGPQGISIEY